MNLATATATATACLALAALAALPAAAQQPAPTPELAPAAAGAPVVPEPPFFPYQVRRSTLGNGLQVLLVKHPSPRLAAFFLFFRAGSRDEVEPGRTGHAHLLEHLAFRGGSAEPGADWERATKDLGLDTNAFTDDDLTAYWASGPAESLPALIALEAHRFANLSYSEDAYQVEARTVLGEYLKDAGSPDFKLLEAVRAAAFAKHPYGHTTMGREADIRRMPAGYRHSQEVYRRWYRPENATVLVVGDFDEGAVLARIEERFGPWRPEPAAPAAATEAEPPQTAPREVRRPWPVPLLPRHFTGWKTPGADDLDATAVQMVLWPYLFGPASALARELVLERQLAGSIGGEYLPRRDPFLFGASLVLRAPAAEKPARAALEAAVASLARGRVDERLLEDVRANLLASVRMQTDTPHRAGLWLVYATALAGDPGRLEALLARSARVEGRDLTAFARRHLVATGRVSVTITGGTGGPPPSARRGGR